MRARLFLVVGVVGLGLVACRTSKPDGYDAFKIPDEEPATAQASEADDAPATKNEDGLTQKPSKYPSLVLSTRGR